MKSKVIIILAVILCICAVCIAVPYITSHNNEVDAVQDTTIDDRIGEHGVQSSVPNYSKEELEEIEKQYNENFEPNLIIE